jgi:hypothetical protein
MKDEGLEGRRLLMDSHASLHSGDDTLFQHG